MRYNRSMIKSFKHKGLRLFFETGSMRGIQPEHSSKLQRLLFVLDNAEKVEHLNLPGYNLHQLKGDLSGQYALTVNGNWRLTFMFENKNVYILDYQDYH